MKESKKPIKVYVTDEQRELINKVAKKENMKISNLFMKSMSNYINSLTDMDDMNIPVSEEPETSDDVTGIFFQEIGPLATEVQKQAAEAGIPVAVYIRNVLSKHSMNIINIDTHDLEKLIGDIKYLSQHIHGIINAIETSGQGKVFKQDVEIIKNELDTINMLLSEEISITYKNRNTICKNVVNEIIKRNIERNK